MSTMYDPSDINNTINGFNIIECCQFKPVDLYIMIPNIGYGFAAHVLENFQKEINTIKPGRGFSIKLIPDSKGESNSEFGVTISTSIRKYFAPIGISARSDFMIMKIPLNSQCTRKVKIETPLRLPLACKVRDISNNGGGNNVMRHVMVQDAQCATFGLSTSAVCSSISGSNDPVRMALAATHFRAASDLLANKPDDQGTYPDDPNKWTGIRDTDTERVEFTHFFTGQDNLLHNISYFDIVSKMTTQVPLAECLLRPAVFVSFEVHNGKKRVFFSDELTRALIPKIEIKGKIQPPRLIFGRTTYTLGLTPENQSQCQLWLRHCTIGNESAYIPDDVLVDPFLSSGAVRKNDIQSEFSVSQIPAVRIMNRLTGSGEQTENCILYTPVPPLFTQGEIYRDSHASETFYLPFSHAYLMPLAAFASAAARMPQGCTFCGGTTVVGYENCMVCDGGEGIRCPRCIDNTETGDNGIKTRAPGFLSEKCPGCAAETNLWDMFSSYAHIYPPTKGKTPCRACSARALQKSRASGDLFAEFQTWIGKEADGMSTCRTCNGTGQESCPVCVNNPDEKLQSPIPGWTRTTCAVCNDDSAGNSEYRGKSTPRPGYLKCTDENVAYAASDAKTELYYGHFKTKNAPTCGDSGKITALACPACGGNRIAYRFRGTDFSTAERVGTEYDKPKSATIGASEITAADTVYATGPLHVPYILTITIPESIDTSWNSSVYVWTPDTSEDTPYKWLPPYLWKCEGSTLRIYRKFPEGTRVELSAYPPFTLTGPTELPGWQKLDGTDTNITANTPFDGVFGYAQDPSGVPIISGLRILEALDVDKLVYKDKETYTEKPLVYHHEGFVHLYHAIFRFYELIKKPANIKVLKHIGTVKLASFEDAIYSRWLYAPLDPSKVLDNSSDATVPLWVKRTAFEDILEFLPAFLIGTEWGDNQEEWNNPPFTTMASFLTDSIEQQTAGGTAIQSALQETAARGVNTRYIEPERSMIFTSITKGSAHKIESNSTSPTAPALCGATITKNPIKNDTRGVFAGDARFMPFRPSVDPVDIAIAGNGKLSVTDIFSNSIAVNEKALCTYSLELLASVHQMAIDIRTALTESMILYDKAEKKIVSPQPQYVIDIKEFPHVHTIKTTLDALTSTINNTKPEISALQTALRTFESAPAERPSGFSTAIRNGITFLEHSLIDVSSLANGILGGYTEGSDRRITCIAKTTDGNYIGLGIKDDALGKGLHLYNIRKTYLCISAMFSLLAAAIERLLVYMGAFSRTYSPFPAFEVDAWRDLDIFAFMSSDQEICYPEVIKDISIPLDFLTDTVSLNRISTILEDGVIRYSLKLSIEETAAHGVEPVVLTGFGVDPDGQTWFDDWDTLHQYPFQPRGLFADMIGSAPTMDIETDLELDSLAGYREIQAQVSKSDYMVYDGAGIRYLSGPEPTPLTVSISAQECGDAIRKGTAAECPAIAQTIVEGELTMTDLFAYAAPSVTVTVTVPPFFGFSAPFYTGYPFITSQAPVSAGSLESSNNLVWQFDEAQMSRAEVCAQLAQARDTIIKYLSIGRVIHKLFTDRKTYTENGKIDGDYPEVIFAMISLADTSLNTNNSYQHQENALCAFLFKEAAGQRYEAPAVLGNGTTLDDLKIIDDMTPDDHRWIDNQSPATSSVSSSIRSQHRRNYNTWLSKRRSYYTLKMLISSFLANLVEIGELAETDKSKTIDTIGAGNEVILWSNSTFMRDYSVQSYPEYRYRVSLVYSKDGSAPTLTDPAHEMCIKPFHCYGFGGMFAPPNTKDRPGRKEDRVTKMLIHDYRKNGLYHWGFKHDGRRDPVPLAIGQDLHTIRSGTIPTGVTEDIIRGSYILPAMSDKNRWLVTPAYGATAEELLNHGSVTQDAYTENMYQYMHGYVAQEPYATDTQKKLAQIATNTVPSQVSALWSHVSRFLYEKPMVWACKRDGDILHNKIYLKISAMS